MPVIPKPLADYNMGHALCYGQIQYVSALGVHFAMKKRCNGNNYKMLSALTKI